MIKRLAAFTLCATALSASALTAMPPANEWEIGPWARGKNYSIGMPATPREGANGSLVVDFPQAGRGEWDALTTGVGPLKNVDRISIRYRIDAAPGTRFVPAEEPDQTATISVYFQRAGDTWTAKGRYASYRWYAPKQAVMPLKPGEHTISMSLDDRWTNVWHRPREEHEREFAAALSNTARFGIAFGTLGRRSHGVYATGPARFTLLSVDFD
ncbi:MAG: hypothetical protein AAF250_04740 [Pseudomonadota bacterium]